MRDGPCCFLVYPRPPAVHISICERQPEIVEPPFVNGWRHSVTLYIGVVKLIGVARRVHARAARFVYRNRAAVVIWLCEASRREPCCWIRAAQSLNEAVIDTRYVVRRHAPLVRLISVDIQSAGVSPREGQNALIRPPSGELAVLSTVKCEYLRLDRTGT